MLQRMCRMLLFLMALVLLAGGNACAASVEALPLGEDARETLQSIRRVDDDFYCVEYQGDYGLDRLMETGAADGQALAGFISEALLHGLPFQREPIALACSCFAAETPEGDYIQGRNMDYDFAQNILVRTRPDNGYASLSMANGAMLGYFDEVPESLVGRLLILAAPYYAFDGINEAGLSVSILLQSNAEVVHQDTGKPPMTTTMAVRMVLDKAATVDEAIALIGAYDMRGMANANFHYLLVDADGDRAVVEYVGNEMRVLRTEGYGLPVTNFFLSEDAVEIYRDGEDRLEKLQAALDAAKGIVTADEVWTMLDGVKLVHEYDEANDIDYNTAYSILYNSTRRSMDICINANFDAVYSFDVDDKF